MTTPNGRDYRVKQVHPRRPGMPLVVSNRDRSIELRGGETCEGVPADMLQSLIANGYVDRLPAPKAKVAQKGEEG